MAHAMISFKERELIVGASAYIECDKRYASREILVIDKPSPLVMIPAGTRETARDEKSLR